MMRRVESPGAVPTGARGEDKQAGSLPHATRRCNTGISSIQLSSENPSRKHLHQLFADEFPTLTEQGINWRQRGEAGCRLRRRRGIDASTQRSQRPVAGSSAAAT